MPCAGPDAFNKRLRRTGRSRARCRVSGRRAVAERRLLRTSLLLRQRRPSPAASSSVAPSRRARDVARESPDGTRPSPTHVQRQPLTLLRRRRRWRRWRPFSLSDSVAGCARWCRCARLLSLTERQCNRLTEKERMKEREREKRGKNAVSNETTQRDIIIIIAIIARPFEFLKSAGARGEDAPARRRRLGGPFTSRAGNGGNFRNRAQTPNERRDLERHGPVRGVVRTRRRNAGVAHAAAHPGSTLPLSQGRRCTRRLRRRRPGRRRGRRPFANLRNATADAPGLRNGRIEGRKRSERKSEAPRRTDGDGFAFPGVVITRISTVQM